MMSSGQSDVNQHVNEGITRKPGLLSRLLSAVSGAALPVLHGLNHGGDGGKHAGLGRGSASFTETKEGDISESDEESTPVFLSPDMQQITADLKNYPEAITDEQKAHLRHSWELIKRDVTAIGVETFTGLFNTHPESYDSFLAFKDIDVRDIDKSSILKAHALRVMQTVDKCVSRLDQTDKMADLLRKLGRRHIDYQANARLIPLIGQQFVCAMEPKLGSEWRPEIGTAWTAMFAIINHWLWWGMDEELRSRKKAHEGKKDEKQEMSNSRR